LYRQARENATDPTSVIPRDYWSVQAIEDNDEEDEEQVRLRGAVLVRARGHREVKEEDHLTPELESVRETERVRPLHEIFRFLKADGLLAPAALVGALFGAAVGVIIEALLFRNLLELGPELGVSGQRLGAFGALMALLVLLLCIEFPIATGEYRLGRRLEARLRMAFQRKIPLLPDRYFRSRLTSDMAERNHSVHTLRTLPKLGSNILRRVFEMLLTVAGIVWLDPPSAPLAISIAIVTLGMPLLMISFLEERDLRVRTHVGALSRFYLDALLGLTAVFAHSAGRALRSEHESLLTEWARSRLALTRGVLAFEAVPAFLGFGLSAWLLMDHLGRGGEMGVVLLLAYWALNLPVLGLEIAWLAWQYPTRHNIMLRFLEPLGAPEEEAVAETTPVEALPTTGTAIQMQNVTVRSGGHVLLHEIDLKLEAGSHVAVVGASGAGKTSLFGLLLGWHRPAIGSIRIDGEDLDADRLSRTRAETAWVDPAIQIWNRSLLDNLQYGTTDAAPQLTSVIDQAELRSLLEKLPDGYQTSLGEGGGLVSGGEGQRVRLGRALLRPGIRLALLDEPFRGLGRAQRRDLLHRARSFWTGATLLCVTHDLEETRSFDRVLVMDGGTIVEDGAPTDLEAQTESRYRTLLRSEEELQQWWDQPSWKRWRLEEGQIREGAR
jgi:ATP-binding cassette subfamily B protein